MAAPRGLAIRLLRHAHISARSQRVCQLRSPRPTQCWRAAYSSASSPSTPASTAAATPSQPPPPTPTPTPTPSPSNARPASIIVNGTTYPTDAWYNVPAGVLAATSRKLHLQVDHPISITRKILEAHFVPPTFKHHNGFDPVVSAQENFDSLGFPPDHPGRSRSDTYYINADTLLRTHSSAHEAQLFGAQLSAGYTISCDVYRRDEVDRSHYPVFHQMEGARVWDRATVPGGDVVSAIRADLAALPTHDVKVEDSCSVYDAETNPLQPAHTVAEAEAVAAHLKRTLELMVVDIFGRAKAAAARQDPNYVDEPLRMRWVEGSFPFTSPSYELEVYYAGDWLEVLGCGVSKNELFVNAGVPSQLGWAFGIGLDRIAMLLFQIPDIRLFWSRDARFLDQFAGVENDLDRLRRFVPFSIHPPCYKDVSFWLRATSAAGGNAKAANAHDFHENDVMEVVRDMAGAVVEDVQLVDQFTHPKTGRRSMCYRINYRSLERTLTNAETNKLHAKVVREMVDRLGVEIR